MMLTEAKTEADEDFKNQQAGGGKELLPPTIYLSRIYEIRSIKRDKTAVSQNFLQASYYAKIQNLRTFREFCMFG